MLSGNPSITWEIIQANPEYPWEWEGISRNPSITWEIIQANPGSHWNWRYISRNPNVTWDIIKAHPDKPWDMDAVSFNFMSKHPYLIKKQKEKEVRDRIIQRTKMVKEEMMMVYWHPDRYEKWSFDDD